MKIEIYFYKDSDNKQPLSLQKPSHTLTNIQHIPNCGDFLVFNSVKMEVVSRLFDYNSGIVKLSCK